MSMSCNELLQERIQDEDHEWEMALPGGPFGAAALHATPPGGGVSYFTHGLPVRASPGAEERLYALLCEHGAE
jgi:hypothetical protein